MPLSIRARLTLWYSALMALSLIAASLAVLWLHMWWGRAQFDSELASLGAETARVVQEEFSESGDLRRAVLEASNSLDVPNRAMAILDPHGTPMFARFRDFPYQSTQSMQSTLASLTATANAAEQRSFIQTIAGREHAWRVLLRRESSPAGDYVIFVAGTLDQLDQQQRLLSRVLLMAMPLMVLMAAAVCWVVASSALRPVTRMAAQAEAITAQSAEWQLDPAPVDDELGQLTRAFNRLLARLSDALRMQRQFMADASHELRTPVSVIQTATEITLDRDERDVVDYRDALVIIQEQTARLSRTVEDMFLLARADAGGHRLVRRPLYLDEIVAECVKAAAVAASQRQIQLVTRIEPEVAMQGDDGMLRQLVTNVIDNAVRYTPEGGRVTVAVDRDRADAIVSVSDTGPGIAAADRERIFERFVRLDPARSSSSGAGLGLPIARWIAEQHGGTLTLEQSATGGSTFIAHLPLKPQAGQPRPSPSADGGSEQSSHAGGDGHGQCAPEGDA